MSQAVQAGVPLQPAPALRQPKSRVLAWVAVAVLVAAALVGSNAFSVRDRLLGSALPSPVVPATSRFADLPHSGGTLARTSLRSTPWWQRVASADGAGSAGAVPFTIDRSAFQWRVVGSCTTGRLVVRSPGLPQPLIDAPCPQAFGNAERTGPATLEVTAEGPWRLEVDQRIDLPLVEAPLPAMTAPGTKTLATGSFYKVDEVGVGNVSIYDQADGGYSVRLESFWVTPNSNLQLRLSTAEAPRTTQDYLGSQSQLLAVLDVTAGSLNYNPPVGVDPTGFRSVVVWNPSANRAYAAARLGPPS